MSNSPRRGQEENSSEQLTLVSNILEGAFFSPLSFFDWMGFCFGQPALLGLEEEEFFDFFVRAALTAGRLYPVQAENKSPLELLSSLEQPSEVLAMVLTGLRADRPYLFHRVFLALPPLQRRENDPDQYDLAEDYLQAVLGPGFDLSNVAAEEIEVVCRRARQAAGQDEDHPADEVVRLAGEIMQKPSLAQIKGEHELLLWMSLGEGGKDLAPELKPAVLVQVWHDFVRAAINMAPDFKLLTAMFPFLIMPWSELEQYAPITVQNEAEVTAVCPYCHTENRLKLGEKVEPVTECPHLTYVGTSDEVHIMNALDVGEIDLGNDFKQLLASYYQSDSDLELFANIVNDIYELLRGQGRLEVCPVSGSPRAKAFYNLRAYFVGPATDQATKH